MHFGTPVSLILYSDRQLFLKFRYENTIEKKNKPDPALVQTCPMK
jgi:hypothetical protein